MEVGARHKNETRSHGYQQDQLFCVVHIKQVPGASIPNKGVVSYFSEQQRDLRRVSSLTGGARLTRSTIGFRVIHYQRVFKIKAIAFA